MYFIETIFSSQYIIFEFAHFVTYKWKEKKTANLNKLVFAEQQQLKTFELLNHNQFGDHFD